MRKLPLSKRRVLLVFGAITATLVVAVAAIALTSRPSSLPTLEAAPSQSSSGSPSGTNSVAAPTGQQSTASTTIRRWWSSPAGAAGTALDVENPGADAERLSPDPDAYCAMLKSTLATGRSPFALGATSASNVQIQTRAWLAELQALASSPIRDAWKTVGQLILAGPTATPSPALVSDVRSAIHTISTDATTTCHLSLGAS